MIRLNRTRMILAAEASRRSNLELRLDTMAVGVYCDQKVGVVEQGQRYKLISPRHLLVATGAREKALVFPGCELPGVYGAGAVGFGSLILLRSDPHRRLADVR